MRISNQIRVVLLLLCFCISANSQVKSILSAYKIPYCDTFPDQFELDGNGMPINRQWANVPISKEIETEYFNPLISRAGYDYSFYESGEEATVTLLEIYNDGDNKFLLYLTGSFGVSYYLADITSDAKYPPTLLIHYYEGGLAKVKYSYDKNTNEITISCIDRNRGLRLDMKYLLDKNFPFIGYKYYSHLANSDNEDNMITGEDVYLWYEISEKEWFEILQKEK